MTLLVGFDSAWTPSNSGAVVAVLRGADGTYEELGPPQSADFARAEAAILGWQADHAPASTLVLLDQPTIVPNATSSRPVEKLVGSPVSLRRGGMQPANTGRADMFGVAAPVWPFLTRFGGAGDPLGAAAHTRVFETYPVLAIIALGWTLPDARAAGRLPKYNPQRRSTFAIADWQHVCGRAASAFRERSMLETAAWLDEAGRKSKPRKSDQDGVDACLCLLVALYVAEGNECLMVGDLKTGYVVVPYGSALAAELEARCRKTGRDPAEWVRTFRMTL